MDEPKIDLDEEALALSDIDELPIEMNVLEDCAARVAETFAE